MSKRVIIHISDTHISNNNLSQTKEVLDALVNDINAEAEGNVDLIIFSGDLVYSGTEKNFEYAYDEFISPLMSKLCLKEERLVLVPGNHEVDISQIDPYFSKAFTEEIMKNGIDKVDFNNDNIQKRLKVFYSFSDLFYKWDQVNLVSSRIINIDELQYGITYVNTAWNTGGDSKNEAKKIMIPRELIVKSIKEIEKCNVKILVMHHPIDWFADDNAYSIESLLGNYDFVLMGHKHQETCCQFIGLNGKTIRNTVSKLDISKDENGYAIIIHDLEKGQVKIKNRTYVKGRMKYAPDIKISDDGISCFEIQKGNNENEILSDVIVNTKKRFYSLLDDLFIINLLNPNDKKKFDDLFVLPTINKQSDLSIERRKIRESEEVDLLCEIKTHKYTTIWGRKETGKTIIAHYVAKRIYDDYMDYKMLPIIIDCRLLASHKTAILSCIESNIMSLLDDDSTISKKQVEILAKRGLLFIIFDNFDAENKKRINQLEYFETEYPDNKYVFIRDETPAVFSDEDKAAIINTLENSDRVDLFISGFDKHRIRLLAKNITTVDSEIEDSYVNKIMKCFSSNNMPRTPFAVSLVLSICSETADYLPTNQSKIVENFMERLLEKLNPEEVLLKTYNFDNKEKFLASFAYELYRNKKYFISKENFISFTQDYHKKKGYDLIDSKFDKIFFEKGIIVEYNDNVFFRYECLIYYYLAKYCSSNKAFFENEIINEKYLLQNANVISYYAGLNNDDKFVLDTLLQRIKPHINEKIDGVSLLETDSIKLKSDLSEDEIRKRLEEKKPLTNEEKDKISDIPDRSLYYNPFKMSVDYNYNKDLEFGIMIELLGNVIRSCEELLADYKEQAIVLYVQGCLILWKQFRESLLDFISVVNDFIINNKESDNDIDYGDVKESINKAKTLFCDIIKLSVPIAISNFMFDSVGSDKLKSVLLNIYNEYQYNKPEKLLMLLLLCDLKVRKWDVILKDFIKETNKKDYLWIVFFKCNYYLEFKYFSDLQKIKEITAECYIAANNLGHSSKSRILQALETKSLPIKKDA